MSAQNYDNLITVTRFLHGGKLVENVELMFGIQIDIYVLKAS